MTLLNSEILLVANILTRVTKYKGNCNKTIIIIPGNPGLDTYYCYFMTCIVDKLTDDAAAAEGSDVKIPDIVCMSYAGHVNPGHNELTGELRAHNETRYVYSLQDQIEHNIDYIDNHVPEKNVLYFVGHSIGCYICLQVINRLHVCRIIRKGLMLYPAIERMQLTPQGRKLYPILGLLEWVVPSIARCLSWLPVATVKSIIRWKLGPQPPECIVDATHQFIHPRGIANCLYLLRTEFAALPPNLTASECSGIRTAVSVCPTRFYYGRDDHWSPEKWGLQLAFELSGAYVSLCESGTQHAFVVNDSRCIAALVTDWLRA